MRKKTAMVLTVIGAFLIPPVSADGHKKCSETAETCIRAMTEKLENKGWIGIEMEESERGRVITAVVSGSPAEQAGLVSGDVMVAFNGVELSENREAVYAEMKRSLIPEREITITVERDGKKTVAEITLSRIPRELIAQWIGRHMLEGHAHETAEATAPGEDGSSGD